MSSNTSSDSKSLLDRLRPVLQVALAIGIGFLIFAVLKGTGQMRGDTAEASGSDAPLVETVQVRAAGSEYEITAQGFLRPQQQVGIVPEITGKVTDIAPDFVPGGRFAAGEVMFRVDQRTYQAQLKQALSDLESAKATARQARADLARQEELADIGAVSEARLEQARAQAASADARVGQASGQVEIARKSLDDTVLRAPFDAIVAEENVSLGQYVGPGEPVAQLYSAEAAELLVSLSPQEAAAVRRAEKAQSRPLEATISPARGSALETTLRGEVTKIASAINPSSRTVEVTVLVADAFLPVNDGLVYANDFVSVTLPARSTRTIFAAQGDVIRGGNFVWVVTGDETLARTPVSPLGREGQLVRFTSSEDLAGRRLLATSLTEERDGMDVRLERGPRAQMQLGSAAGSP